MILKSVALRSPSKTASRYVEGMKITKLNPSQCQFAGPLAQGVIEGSCSSSLFVTPLYPPGVPRPPFLAGLGAPRALLGFTQGSPELRGAPKIPKGDPKDPPGTPQGPRGTLPRMP